MDKGNNFFGFTSVGDFWESVTRLKDWTFNAVPAIIAGISSFITGYIWDTPEAVWTLWILMLVDWSTGIVKSSIKKEFVSYKIFRMPLYFLATSFALGISWWMAKSSVLFIPLPGLVYGGFLAVYFISVLENLGELELLPKSIVKVVKERFGLKAIIAHWDKKNADNVPQIGSEGEAEESTK